MSFTSGGYSVETLMPMPAFFSSGSRKFLISLVNGSTFDSTATDLTPCALSIAVSSTPMRSGIAEVGNHR